MAKRLVPKLLDQNYAFVDRTLLVNDVDFERLGDETGFEEGTADMFFL